MRQFLVALLDLLHLSGWARWPAKGTQASQDFGLDHTAYQAQSRIAFLTPPSQKKWRCPYDATHAGSAGYRLTSGVYPARIRIVEATRGSSTASIEA